MENTEKEQSAQVASEQNLEDAKIEQPQEQKTNIVPPQYRGLPKEVVEELWLDPEYIDPQKNLEAQERREKALAQIEQDENAREAIKEQSLADAYGALPEDRKTEFPSAQQDVEQITTEVVQGNRNLDGLTPEEEIVIRKLQAGYREFKAQNPDKSFEVKLDNPTDSKVYNNLKYRLAFEELNQRALHRDQERLSQVRQELGLKPQTIEDAKEEKAEEAQPTPKAEVKAAEPEQENPEKLYGEFKVKNGETDTGAFWYEYSNAAAKKLKESGQFEWGKERIYFDIPMDKMELMRDLAFKISKESQIPIAFKHLDVEKSFPVVKDDAETTRFVANFASVEDAKRFYEALSSAEEYKTVKSDRNSDYHGLNLDGVAHYASGFREQRVPLENIVKTATENPDGTYSYLSANTVKLEDGTMGKKKITISKEQYEKFKSQYESSDPKKAWEEAGKNKEQN